MERLHPALGAPRVGHDARDNPPDRLPGLEAEEERLLFAGRQIDGEALGQAQFTFGPKEPERKGAPRPGHIGGVGGSPPSFDAGRRQAAHRHGYRTGRRRHGHRVAAHPPA